MLVVLLADEFVRVCAWKFRIKAQLLVCVVLLSVRSTVVSEVRKSIRVVGYLFSIDCYSLAKVSRYRI